MGRSLSSLMVEQSIRQDRHLTKLQQRRQLNKFIKVFTNVLTAVIVAAVDDVVVGGAVLVVVDGQTFNGLKPICGDVVVVGWARRFEREFVVVTAGKFITLFDDVVGNEPVIDHDVLVGIADDVVELPFTRVLTAEVVASDGLV